MTVGFRVRDANTGRVTLEITDRITRILGSRYISGSGSFAVPDLSQGAGWVSYIDSNPTPFSSPPVVSVSGTIISWYTQNINGAPGRGVTIIYGVY